MKTMILYIVTFIICGTMGVLAVKLFQNERQAAITSSQELEQLRLSRLASETRLEQSEARLAATQKEGEGIRSEYERTQSVAKKNEPLQRRIDAIIDERSRMARGEVPLDQDRFDALGREYFRLRDQINTNWKVTSVK
jgi:galactokinase